MRKFTLKLSAAENIDFIEKYFQPKLRKIKFPTKNSMEAYIFLPVECC